MDIEQLNGSQTRFPRLAVFSAFVTAAAPASELTSTPLAVFAPTNRRDGGVDGGLCRHVAFGSPELCSTANSGCWSKTACSNWR